MVETHKPKKNTRTEQQSQNAPHLKHSLWRMKTRGERSKTVLRPQHHRCAWVEFRDHNVIDCTWWISIFVSCDICRKCEKKENHDHHAWPTKLWWALCSCHLCLSNHDLHHTSKVSYSSMLGQVRYHVLVHRHTSHGNMNQNNWIWQRGWNVKV